jgi:hypothetical protein
MGAPLRKKLTPLQSVKFTEVGDAVTSFQEELESGILAMDFLRQKNDTELMRMLVTYSVLATKLKVEQSVSQKKTLAKEFSTLSTKMFKHAASIGVFKDTRVFAGSLLQALDYLLESPEGEYAPLAKEVIEQLNVVGNYGAPTTNTNSFFNPWLMVAMILIIIKISAGRSA